MRSMVVTAFGGPEVLRLEEGPGPALGPRSVRIEVHAAGVNFADSLLLRGRYQVRPRPPFVPGLEIAGVVQEVGAETRACRVGDRVLGVMRYGGYADEVVMPEENTYPLPPGMDFTTGAAFPVAYGTAHGALSWKAALATGETCLVLGAAGGVGLAGVEVAAAMGARVIAAAGSDEKLAICRAHGAVAGINYQTERVRGRLPELAPDGVNVVLDTVGGNAGDDALRRLAWDGRIVTVGFAAGRIPAFPANRLLLQNAAVHGLYWGEVAARDPGQVGDSLARLGQWYCDGQLRPRVAQVLPLGDAAHGIELLLSRAVSGKVVLDCRR